LIVQFAQSKSIAYNEEYKWVLGDIKYYMNMHKFKFTLRYIALFILYFIPVINIIVVFGRLLCTMDSDKMRYLSNCIISMIKPHVDENYPHLYSQVGMADNIEEDEYYMYTIKLVVELNRESNIKGEED
jgi:hypothetical protein